MALYAVEDTVLAGIADSIRAKSGSADTMEVTEFKGAIDSIPSGGGLTTDRVLTNGVISDLGSYRTATYTKDISAYKYLIIKINAEVSGSIENTFIVDVSKISSSGINITARVNSVDVHIKVTTTDISTWQYSGNWMNVYADVWATDFDFGNI